MTGEETLHAGSVAGFCDCHRPVECFRINGAAIVVRDSVLGIVQRRPALHLAKSGSAILEPSSRTASSSTTGSRLRAAFCAAAIAG